MSNIMGQAETPWQEFIMPLIQIILYTATRLIILKYTGIMSFHALKSSMTISYGMKSEHLFCHSPLTSPYLFPPSSLCPLVKLDESIFSWQLLYPEGKVLFTSPLPLVQSYLLMHSFPFELRSLPTLPCNLCFPGSTALFWIQLVGGTCGRCRAEEGWSQRWSHFSHSFSASGGISRRGSIFQPGSPGFRL